MKYRRLWQRSLYPFRAGYIETQSFFNYLDSANNLDVDTDSHIESVPALSRLKPSTAAIIELEQTLNRPKG